MREIKQSVIAFGVFCASIFIVILINSNITITGNIINTNLDVGNCSNTEIDAIWDFIFLEDSLGNIKIKENQVNGYCDKYLVYEYDNTNGVLLVISGNIYNNSWNSSYLYYEENRLLSDFGINFMYFNVSDAFMTIFDNQNTIESKKDALNNLSGIYINELTNWSVQNITKLNETFLGIYEPSIYLGVTDDSWIDDDTVFIYNNNIDTNNNYSTFFYLLVKNKSAIMNSYSTAYFDPLFFMESLGDFPDVELLNNSDWNITYNLSNYFNVSDDVNVIFSSVGDGNSNGELINYSISGENVSFKPIGDFIGSVEFELTAVNPSETGNDIISNKFNITIYNPNAELETEPEVNNAPNQTGNISDIYLSHGGLFYLDLDLYFEDIDNDWLIYTLDQETNNINVSINVNVMNISLGENFSEYERFKIRVSDGFVNITSEWIYVRINESQLDEYNFTAILMNDTNNNKTINNEEMDVLETPLNLLSVEDVDSGEDSASGTSISENGFSKTRIIIISVIMGLAIIAIVAIIMSIGKKPEVKSYSPSPISADYGKSSSIKKYGGPISSSRINKPRLQQRIPIKRNINPNLRNTAISNSYNRNPRNNPNQFRM